jgi:glycosyltransferase involved in cell wall biosynthesis
MEKNENPSIWFDLTTTLNFHGRPPVGIVRCEQECARWLSVKHAECTRFCVYDRPNNTFLELEKETVHELLRAQRHEGELDTSVRANVLDKLEIIAKPYVRRLPFESRQRLKACYKSVSGMAKMALRYMRSWKSNVQGLRSLRKISPMSLRPIEFSSSTIYISFGLDWDYKDMFELYEMKRQYGFRTILMCYDIVPVKFPHFAAETAMEQTFAKYLTDIAWCADLMLCISKNTMRDLDAFLGSVAAPVPLLSVVTLGSEVIARNPEISNGTFPELHGKNFILYVSTIEARKNHEVLYRSYVRLVESGEKDIPIMVFVGMLGWSTSDLVHFLRHDPLVKDLFLLCNNVGDTELAWLYENAYFTVYPSLYEGWGLPIAESLAHGKLCLASSTSSLPEVGGDLIDYLDPVDVLGWTEKLRYYFANPDEVQKRNDIIRSNYQPPTWEAMAEEVYNLAMSNRSRQ